VAYRTALTSVQRLHHPVRVAGAPGLSVRRCSQDRLELIGGPIKIVVDDHMVELGGAGLLGRGGRQAALDLFGVVLAPVSQASALLLPRGGADEHEHRVGERLPNREGALDVDLEDHVVTRPEVLLDGRPGCSFEVVVDLEPLQEAARIAQPLELGAVDELVIAAVDLTRARVACRRRRREPESGLACAQAPNEGSLAGARRAGDDEQDAQKSRSL
jgi:hypothetical protein